MVENPRFAVGIVVLSVIVPAIKYFRFWATLSFPVVGHCRNHLATLFGLYMVESTGLAIGILTLSVVVPVL